MWSVETISSEDGDRIKDAVHELAGNNLAAVRIPGVFTGEEIDTVVSNINQQGVTWYPNFEFKQGRIGIGATEYASKINGREAYFLLEAESSRTRDKVFPGELDPVGRWTDIFSQGLETSVAVEPALGNARYFTGLVRAMMLESTTHFDHAPKQLPGWWVSQAPTQLSAVTYLQMPGSGGELTVYDRLWKEEDEQYNRDVREKGPNGFDGSFLADADSVTVEPNAGEMIVFNPKNYHRVQGITSEVARLSVNTFISVSDDTLHLWN